MLVVEQPHQQLANAIETALIKSGLYGGSQCLLLVNHPPLKRRMLNFFNHLNSYF